MGLALGHRVASFPGPPLFLFLTANRRKKVAETWNFKDSIGWGYSSNSGLKINLFERNSSFFVMTYSNYWKVTSRWMSGYRVRFRVGQVNIFSAILSTESSWSKCTSSSFLISMQAGCNEVEWVGLQGLRLCYWPKWECSIHRKEVTMKFWTCIVYVRVYFYQSLWYVPLS